MMVTMVYFSVWKKIAILMVCLFGFATALPNVFEREVLQGLPGIVPQDQLNLGLDLQGGSHLLLQVKADVVVAEKLDSMVDQLRQDLNRARGQKEITGYKNLGVVNGAAGFDLREIRDSEKAQEIAREIAEDYAGNAGGLLGGGGGRVLVSLEGGRLTLRPDDALLLEWRQKTVEQAIETVRRRVDETGTREPTIPRLRSDYCPGSGPRKPRGF